jgi:hypothetical protein
LEKTLGRKQKKLDDKTFKLLANFVPRYLRYEEKWDEYSFIVTYENDEYFLGFTPDFPEPKISRINKGEYVGEKIDNHFKLNGIGEIIFNFCQNAYLKRAKFMKIDD